MPELQFSVPAYWKSNCKLPRALRDRGQEVEGTVVPGQNGAGLHRPGERRPSDSDLPRSGRLRGSINKSVLSLYI